MSTPPASMRGRPNRSIATAPMPSAGQTSAQTGTDASTYFTKASGESELLVKADRLWATVTLTLESAGPVAVGFKSSITPVLSGKGILLQTNEPRKFVIAKGATGGAGLYIASTSVNRVSVVVEPLPWMEQITASIGGVIAAIMKTIAGGK